MYPTKDDFYGFVFYYDNGDLSQPDTKSKTEVSMLPFGTGNDDAIYIFCNKCNRYMCFEDEKKGMDTSRWTCPVCGASVSVEQPYDILEEMNREFEKWLYTDDDN